MRIRQQPNWTAAGRILLEALETYRSRKKYDSMARVIDDLVDYLPGHQGEPISTKTVRRDISGAVAIPTHRIELYAQWLYDYAHAPPEQIASWLEQTVYPRPGELLARVCEGSDDPQVVFGKVRKSTLPTLRTYLWGTFLQREAEMESAIQWADTRHPTIAFLWGFGGNGKTTLQLKIGADFVYGPNCPLRWPFEAVAWVSAQQYPAGRPTLFDVLATVLETFDIPIEPGGRTRTDWIRREAERLLKAHRVLVLVDNFETITQQYRDEILAFFGHLHGTSQLLISSRYRPDMGPITYTLIPVKGLLPDQAARLIQDYLDAKAIAPDIFTASDLARLGALTGYNPKVMLSILGMVEQGIPLDRILDGLTQGTPESDRIFDGLMDRAWKELLTKTDHMVLMAKAFFTQPVHLGVLAQVAHVREDKAAQAVAKLQTIAFLERTQETDGRVRAHPLAQDTANRILVEHPVFAQQAEERWWSIYVTNVVSQALQVISLRSQLRPTLHDDITNVVERFEQHLRRASPFARRAAMVFAEPCGLGYALRHLGRWDELLQLGELVMSLATTAHDAYLLGRTTRLVVPPLCNRHEYDQVMRILAHVAEQNVLLDDRQLQADIEWSHSQLYSEQGLLLEAIAAIQRVLAIYRELGDVLEIARAYTSLSSLANDVAIANLDQAIDPHWQANPAWAEMDAYLQQARHYWAQLDSAHPIRRLTEIFLTLDEGVNWRVRGNLTAARQLIQQAIDLLAPSIILAGAYQELALVEHLDNNRALAYQYEAQSVALLRDLKVAHSVRSYVSNSTLVIERLKQEGRW